MTLSEIITDYRRQHDLSQRQFAVQCDLSNGYISLLEKGINPKTGKPVTPTLVNLRKIAKGMHITIDDLLTMADDLEVDLSKKPVPDNEDGQMDDVDLEIAAIIMNLNPQKKQEALGFLRYLESREDK